MKRRSRRTELKIACERIRQEQRKRKKAPEEKRFVRTVVGAVLFVVGVCCLRLEKISRTRKELNFYK